MKTTDKAQELLDQLHKEVGTILSGDDWKHYLDIARSLHHYSWNNSILIHMQGGTMVAGYKAWQKKGRQVRKGSKGIFILAPLTVKKTNEETGEERRILIGFRGACVFDVSQTDGPELPKVELTLLEGEAPSGMRDRLVTMVEEEGYSYETGDCGSAYGFTDPLTKVVRVREGMSDAQTAQTVTHELAHIMLHHTEGYDYQGCRGEAEVEAESVAYVVAGLLGLPTENVSFPYVTGWSGGDPEKVVKTGERVMKAVKRITERLEKDLVAA